MKKEVAKKCVEALLSNFRDGDQTLVELIDEGYTFAQIADIIEDSYLWKEAE